MRRRRVPRLPGAERARLTRRAALSGAAALALTRPAPAPAAADAEALEVAALADLIRREQAASLAYAASGMPRLAAHEREHALALRPHLQHLGHPLPPAPRTAGRLDRAAAIALEEGLVEAYRARLGALRDPATIRTAATVMASHGQHLAVLTGAVTGDGSGT
jgi:hypothetical protein